MSEPWLVARGIHRHEDHPDVGVDQREGDQVLRGNRVRVIEDRENLVADLGRLLEFQ